jgi:hypothetical protein
MNQIGASIERIPSMEIHSSQSCFGPYGLLIVHRIHHHYEGTWLGPRKAGYGAQRLQFAISHGVKIPSVDTVRRQLCNATRSYCCSFSKNITMCWRCLRLNILFAYNHIVPSIPSMLLSIRFILIHDILNSLGSIQLVFNATTYHRMNHLLLRKCSHSTYCTYQLAECPSVAAGVQYNTSKM